MLVVGVWAVGQCGSGAGGVGVWVGAVAGYDMKTLNTQHVAYYFVNGKEAR